MRGGRGISGNHFTNSLYYTGNLLDTQNGQKIPWPYGAKAVRCEQAIALVSEEKVNLKLQH